MKSYIFLLVVAVLYFFMLDYLMLSNCEKVAKKLNLEFNYGFFKGCLVKQDHHWKLIQLIDRCTYKKC